MPALPCIQFRSLRTQLLVCFLALSIIPLAALGWLAYRRSSAALEHSAGVALQQLAKETIDKIDRNLFERYGDVQAFAANPKSLGTPDELRDAANFYTKCYGIYDLMLIVDLEGTVLAANTVDQNGEAIASQALVGSSVKGEAWFEKIASGEVKLGATYFSDPTLDPAVAQVKGQPTLVLNFSAPIVDADGQVRRIWSNRASWDRIVTQITKAQRESLAALGMTKTEIQVLSKQGLLLDDLDPAAVLKLNLADAGLTAARAAIRGESGYAIETHVRRQVEQINGYAASQGALGFAGYGWGVLMRQDLDEAQAPAVALRNLIGLLSLLAAGLVGGLAFTIARSLARPVVETSQVLEQVAAGDLSPRLHFARRDEFHGLANSLNTAIEAQSRSLEEIRLAAEREQEQQAARAAEERRRGEEEQRRRDAEAQREREENARQQRESEELQRKVDHLLEVVNRVGQGDYSRPVEVRGTDAIGKLGEGLRTFCEAKQAQELRDRQRADEERRVAAEEQRRATELRGKVDELLSVVAAASQGDLTREVSVRGSEPVDELAGALQKMLGDLRGIIGNIIESSAQFSEGSRVIAESSQSLAGAAQTQSQAVEEVNHAVDELSQSVAAVASFADSAHQAAQQTTQLAERGGEAVRKSSDAMSLIKGSSSQIAEIIQVISEIANQTNLLALNAAIEAARAGEHGLGFAVVADEVRKLAERANQAAGQVSNLIRESSKRVDEGAALSEETSKALSQIIAGVRATAEKISQISGATVEQTNHAGEVQRSISSIVQVAEQTAAQSEELAASSEQLGAQSVGLRELVEGFRIERTTATLAKPNTGRTQHDKPQPAARGLSV